MERREEEIDGRSEENRKRGKGRGKERKKEDTKAVIDFTQDPYILNHPITKFH